MAEQHYVTLEEIRAEPGIPDDLDDATTSSLRRAAETLVDNALGAWPVNETGAAEGRKIDPADVDAWRYDKVKGAVLALAGRLHANPELLGPRFESVSGPDFSLSNPTGTVYGTEARALLYASGLVVTGAIARP